MKNTLQFIGAMLIVLAGASVTIVADRYRILPGVPYKTVSSSAKCPHTLRVDDCPFCDESLIEKQGECRGHGVPEALCYQCRPALIAAFKAVHDWCAGHDVPESQCYDCNPELLRATKKQDFSSTEPIITVGLSTDKPRSLQAPELGCRTHTLSVQFKSPQIAQQIGLQLAKVETRKISHLITCNAEIKYDGRRYARLAPRTAAVVSSIDKDLGDYVKQGELIAVFHSIDIAVAKINLLKHLENVETMKSKLAQAKRSFELKNLMELRLAAVQYLKSRELRVVAQKNLVREQRLLKSSATSEKDFLTAQGRALEASAAVKALAKELLIYGLSQAQLDKLSWQNIEAIKGRGVTSAQPYLKAQVDLRVAQADLSATRKRLQLLGLSEDEIDAVVRTADSSGELPLYAPFSGVIVKRNAVIGELARPDGLSFALADTKTMWASLDIEESNLAKLRVGLPVTLQVQSLRGYSFKGKITWLSSQIDDKTRVLKARAELDNPKGILRANMFASASVYTQHNESSILVPKAALQWEGCCNVVFVKVSDQEFIPRKVHPIFETGEHVVIASGLTGNELVVTTGSFLLKTEILKGNIGAGCCGD